MFNDRLIGCVVRLQAALPRLRQLLRLVSARATPHQVMLDLCGSGWHKAPDAIDRLVRCVNSFNVASRVVIASYEVPLLERISHSFPSVALCLLVEERDECLPIAHLASLAKQVRTNDVRRHHVGC